MRMLRTAPFFPSKSGEKPYLEVFSRFGLWRNFLNDKLQATISVFRMIKTMSINPKSVEFHQCHDKPHSTYHNIKENEINLCQDLLTIENTESDLKVHALHYANELLVRVRLSFQNFCKIAQHTETIRNVWEKSNDMYSLSIRVQTTINQIRFLRYYVFFLRQYHGQRKCFLSERELKKAWRDTLRDTLTRAASLGPSNF